VIKTGYEEMKKLDISEMKLPPELREEETVLAVVKGFVQMIPAIIALTSERICIRPEKSSPTPSDTNTANQEIELKEIKALRKTGFLQYTIEIETDKIYQLPKIPATKEVETFIKILIERAGLKRTEWGKESKEKRVAKGIFGGVIASFGFLTAIFIGLIGIFLVILGLLLCLSLIGIILGILCLIFGIFLLSGAVGAGGIGALGGTLLGRREEWKK